MLIKTKDKQLTVPISISDYKELEIIINSKVFTAIQNLDTKFKLNELVMKYVVGITLLLALISFFILEDKRIKLGVGIPILLSLSVALFYEYRNKKSSYISISSLVKLSFFLIALLLYLIYIAVLN